MKVRKGLIGLFLVLMLVFLTGCNADGSISSSEVNKQATDTRTFIHDIGPAVKNVTSGVFEFFGLFASAAPGIPGVDADSIEKKRLENRSGMTEVPDSTATPAPTTKPQ